MTSSVPPKIEIAKAIIHIIRQHRLSRKLTAIPIAAMQSIRTKSGISAGGTLNEKKTSKNVNR